MPGLKRYRHCTVTASEGKGKLGPGDQRASSRGRPGAPRQLTPPPEGQRGLPKALALRPGIRVYKGHLKRGLSGGDRLTGVSIPQLGAWQAVRLLDSAQGSPPLGHRACCGWTLGREGRRVDTHAGAGSVLPNQGRVSRTGSSWKGRGPGTSPEALEQRWRDWPVLTSQGKSHW